jgi:hypothetical protein
VPIIPKTPQIPNCKCVAFTLDAIQDYYISNVQLAVIKSFDQLESNITVGVFGKFIGTSPKIVGQLKDLSKNNNPKIEFANRGWENIDHTQYPQEIQSASISKTNEKISNLFDTMSVTYIPSGNSFNRETLGALNENGIKYISSSAKPNTITLTGFNSSDPLYIPQTLEGSELFADDPFYLGPINKKALTKINEILNSTGFAVVNLQAKEYATRNGEVINNQVNAEELKNLEQFLDILKSTGIKTVTISQISKEMPSQRFPLWTSIIQTWHEEEKISHEELIVALNYLTLNGKIK